MDEHGLKEEKKQVMELADYIDGMEKKFGAVLEELGTVKEQLGQIQDKGIKHAALRVVTKIEGKVQDARQQLYAVKARFIAGVGQAVEDFKHKGISALHKSLDVLGVQSTLLKFKECLHWAVESMDQHFDRFSNIGDELHEAGSHLGNAGRTLLGKEAKTASPRDVEKGAIFQMQKLLYHTAGTLRRMEKRTDCYLQGAMQLEDKAKTSRKPSVRENLKELEAKGQRKDKEVHAPGEKHRKPIR